jgi:hypothetical protein
MYASRTRNGLTPASRVKLLKKLKSSEKTSGRWRAELTAAKMAACWLGPVTVDQFEFVGVPPTIISAHQLHRPEALGR